MFTRLLDSARADVNSIPPTPVNSSKTSKQTTTPSPSPSNEELCELFSEFLFDIFDANCMEEFKQIEKLELAHCSLFAQWNKGDEFTLQQGDAHHEFVHLFEQLCSEFLIQNDVTQSQLFQAAKSILEEEGEGGDKVAEKETCWEQSPLAHANEIWDVVNSVENISVWATAMKDTFERHRGL
jgi:hypothetical protein